GGTGKGSRPSCHTPLRLHAVRAVEGEGTTGQAVRPLPPARARHHVVRVARAPPGHGTGRGRLVTAESAVRVPGGDLPVVAHRCPLRVWRGSRAARAVRASCWDGCR